MEIRALVVGASGLSGRGVSEAFLETGATVFGLSRHSDGLVDGVQHLMQTRRTNL